MPQSLSPSPVELPPNGTPSGMPGNTADAVMRAPEVLHVTGFKARKTLWAKSRDPDDPFPAPIELGGGKIGWRASEIMDWLDSRPRVLYAPNAA